MKVTEIANKFEYSGQFLRNLAESGAIPKAKGGDMDFEVTAIGVVKHLKRLLENAAGARSELAKSRAALATEELETKRQKRLEKAKELVPKNGVELVWSARKAAVRQRIEQLAISKQEKDDVLAEMEVASVEEYLK